jgi:hypothetical protein
MSKTKEKQKTLKLIKIEPLSVVNRKFHYIPSIRFKLLKYNARQYENENVPPFRIVNHMIFNCVFTFIDDFMIIRT